MLKRKQFTVSLGLLAALAWLAVDAPQARGEDIAYPEQVVRYLAVRTGMGKDGTLAILYVEPMQGGKRYEVTMRNSPRMVDYFVKLAPGQPVGVLLRKIDGTLYLERIEAIHPRPGEAERDTAYFKKVETRKIKGKDVTVAIFTKYKLTSVVVVPKVRTDKGMETSPKLLAALKAIKPDTLTEVEVASSTYAVSRREKLPVMKFVAAWAPWRKGVYTNKGRKTIAGVTYSTVEIKSAGIPLQLLVPKIGRSDDRTVSRVIYKLKKNQAVEFKIRQEGLNQYVRKIRPPAPKVAAPPRLTP